MRRIKRAVMAALAIMMSYSLLGVTAGAGQSEGMPGANSSGTSGETVGTVSSNDASNAYRRDVLPGAPDKDGDVVSFQIPQKLGVVIDPWEVAGKGQIYSEEYTIRNTGKETGILTLSFLCRRGEDSTAVIRTDNIGLHDDENKSIYIEMIFGETEGIILMEEGLEYQAQLGPGEELAVRFAGEVNEYASESWQSSDVEIEGVYFWEIVEDADGKTDGTESSGVDVPDKDGAEQPSASKDSDASLSVEGVQDKEGLGTEDGDVAGTDFEDTGQQSEMDDAEDGREG